MDEFIEKMKEKRKECIEIIQYYKKLVEGLDRMINKENVNDESLKYKKCKKIYDAVNDTFINEHLKIEKCCKKNNVSLTLYYKSCKYLDKKTISEICKFI